MKLQHFEPLEPEDELHFEDLLQDDLVEVVLNRASFCRFRILSFALFSASVIFRSNRICSRSSFDFTGMGMWWITALSKDTLDSLEEEIEFDIEIEFVFRGHACFCLLDQKISGNK